MFVDQMAARSLGSHSAVCHWYSGSYVCRSNGGLWFGVSLCSFIGIAVHMFVDQMAARGLGSHSAVSLV